MKGPFGFFASLTKGVGNKILFYSLLAISLIALGSAVFCSDERAQDVMNEGFYDPRLISLGIFLFALAIQAVNLIGSYNSFSTKKTKAQIEVQKLLSATNLKTDFYSRACKRIAFSCLLDGYTMEEAKDYLVYYMESPEDEAEFRINECATFLTAYL